MHSLVMTILGPDRPGVVESVAKTLSKHGGNWLESRMAHLAGQFAGIVHAEVPADQVDLLTKALQGLSSQGLTVLLHVDLSDTAPISYAALWLELMGGDRPGIVSEVTRVLAEHQVNVEEFQTECLSAPMSGDKVFKATARLRPPAGLSVLQLQQALEKIASDLMVDIHLQSTHLDR